MSLKNSASNCEKYMLYNILKSQSNVKWKKERLLKKITLQKNQIFNKDKIKLMHVWQSALFVCSETVDCKFW